MGANSTVYVSREQAIDLHSTLNKLSNIELEDILDDISNMKLLKNYLSYLSYLSDKYCYGLQVSSYANWQTYMVEEKTAQESRRLNEEVNAGAAVFDEWIEGR